MNLKIKEIIEKELKGYIINNIILFGSRARGDFNENSDYDILIVVENNLTLNEVRKLTSQILTALAYSDIHADILIRSENHVNYMKHKIGNVIKYAFEEGLTL